MITVQLTDEQVEALHALLGNALDQDHDAISAGDGGLAEDYDDDYFVAKVNGVVSALSEAQKPEARKVSLAINVTATVGEHVPPTTAEEVADAILDNLDFARLPFEVEVTWEEAS